MMLSNGLTSDADPPSIDEADDADVRHMLMWLETKRRIEAAVEAELDAEAQARRVAGVEHR